MRSLLLGLLPLACTLSSAAPSKDRPAERKTAAPASKVIVEKGAGCGQEIAEDGKPGGIRRESDARIGASGPGRGGAVHAPRSVAPGMPAPPPPPGPMKRRAPSPSDMAADEADAEGAPRPAGRPPMQQQPSGVRAGEWDDNANYRDYAKWLADRHAPLDISNRQFLVVKDRDGKAVPNCPIALKGTKGSATLVTPASGRALLFPGALGLGDQITATTQCLGATATASVSTKTLDNVVELALPSPRALPAKRTVELAFVLDTTGSMSEEIAAVKQTIQAVASQLQTAQTDVRIGLVEYKDRSDCILTRTFPFSSDLAAVSRDVAGLSADGGGDMPEDMHAGLSAALDKLQWSPSSVARMVVVIADAPPQMYAQQRHYDDAAKRAAARGIKLYTVAASGMDDRGQLAMRQMAQFTGATNLFVLRGGAGPQSVGGGDPKSSCGGTHQDYSSGNLDGLIIRKVKTELASLDADPMRIAGRGGDENAKPCAQRIVIAN